MANTGYDWQTLVNKIGDTTSQVVSLEIEYDALIADYQIHRHSLELSGTVFIIVLLSSTALFFRSIWAATIAFIVAICFFAYAWFNLHRIVRETGKLAEISPRYTKAKIELETLKAMLTAKAIADEQTNR